MRWQTLSLAVVLSIGGCNKEDDKPAPPANPPTNTSNTDKMMTDAQKTAAEKTAEAQKAAEAKMAEAKKGAEAATEEVQTQAKSLFEQATTYMKEQKWDSAEGAIKKLEELKSKLPAEWQTKVDELRKQFNSAKAAVGNLKLPAFK